MGKVGRPKGSVGKNTVHAQEMRKKLQDKVHKELTPILTSQIDLAKGIVVNRRVKLPSGKWADRFYEKLPDNTAARTLLEQAVGRPPQAIEHSGEVRNIVEVVESLEDNGE